MISLALSLLSPVFGWLTKGWIGAILQPIIAGLTKLVELLATVLGWLLRTVLSGLDWILKKPSAVIATLTLMWTAYAYASYVKPIIAPKKPVIEKRHTNKAKRHRRVWKSETVSREPTYCWWYEPCFYTE